MTSWKRTKSFPFFKTFQIWLKISHSVFIFNRCMKRIQFSLFCSNVKYAFFHFFQFFKWIYLSKHSIKQWTLLNLDSNATELIKSIFHWYRCIYLHSIFISTDAIIFTFLHNIFYFCHFVLYWTRDPAWALNQNHKFNGKAMTHFKYSKSFDFIRQNNGTSRNMNSLFGTSDRNILKT